MAGFGDTIVIFLASLFVVSAGLEAAGVTTWSRCALSRRASSLTRFISATLGPVVSPMHSISATVAKKGSQGSYSPITRTP